MHFVTCMSTTPQYNMKIALIIWSSFQSVYAQKLPGGHLIVTIVSYSRLNECFHEIQKHFRVGGRRGGRAADVYKCVHISPGSYYIGFSEGYTFPCTPTPYPSLLPLPKIQYWLIYPSLLLLSGRNLADINTSIHTQLGRVREYSNRLMQN